MIRAVYFKDNETRISRDIESLIEGTVPKILWLDLINPTFEEKKLIEDNFKLELMTSEEASEIEISSKFYEDADELSINSNFVILEDSMFRRESVSFIQRHGILVTQHETELRSFRDALRRFVTTNEPDSTEILLGIFETRVDMEADLIEFITGQISGIKTEINFSSADLESKLIHINELLEKNMLLRESVSEKQRIYLSLLKSSRFSTAHSEPIRFMLRDISSLLEHIDFNFNRLEYLQNTFLGLISIDQNRIIKIFTVASLVFMPPTLIASLYGMNFKFMPELDEIWGYPLSILIMLLSSGVTIFFFKKKGWL